MLIRYRVSRLDRQPPLDKAQMPRHRLREAATLILQVLRQEMVSWTKDKRFNQMPTPSRKNWKGEALLLLALFAGTPASQADTYQFEVNSELAVSPQRKIDSSTIKNFAGASGKAEIISREAEPVWKPPQKGNLTVSTGSDALLVKSSEYTRLYDFKNKKVFDLDSANKTFSSHSLFGELAFRNAELRNRIFLSEMMGNVFKGKKPGTYFDKFYSEEMFSLCIPEKNSGYKVNKTKQGSEDVYSYNGTIVSSFLPAAALLPADKRRQFSRYLIYATHLHPNIRMDIEKSGKIPQKLMVYLDNRPVSKERKTLVLKNLSAGNFSASVPDGYKAKLENDNPLSKVYARIEELGGKPAADLEERTLEYFQNAVDKKNYFDALLAITEYGLQTGENLSAKTTMQIKAELKNDPDCQKFFGGLNTPENEEQAKLCLGSLDMIDRSKSPKSYLVDIFRANLLIKMNEMGIHDPQTSQEKDPTKAFLSVLQNNPFIAGVYHDLGNWLERSYQHVFAWDCYDLARKFYPDHPFMQEIKEKEEALSSQFPQFISGDKIQ